MKRISDYLRKKGREVIGWDELTNSSFLPEESIIPVSYTHLQLLCVPMVPVSLRKIIVGDISLLHP